ncbi:MAG: universal stress protein [Caldilineaceae bacterium]|nr:universal stress protein [Caldilineaceae bacterium]
MSKNIVVIPLDGSDYSVRILASVQKFLPPGENRLILLRVGKDSRGLVAIPQSPVTIGADMPIYASHQDATRGSHPIYATQIQESQRSEVLAELADTVRGLETLGYEVTVEVTFGDPAEEIINFVTLTPVDLVAMTTHGRSGLGKVLFGNVAEALIHRVNVPVMLLRPFVR